MSLFFKKQEITTSLGIDIGSSSIKVVQLKRDKDKIILETYGEIELGPYAGKEAGQPAHLGEEKTLEALKDLLKEAKITAKDATVAIDSSAAYVSLIRVPQVTDAELATMMPLEARKYIPIPMTEVQMDWWHIPALAALSQDERTTNIVLAAVKNETLTTYDHMVTRLGLTNVDYEIQGFSLVRSLTTVTQNAMVLCVDIGAQYTTLSLVYAHTVLDMHVISRGSQDSTSQLSKALSIPVATAEETKRLFGYKGDISNPYIKDVMQLSSYPLFGEIARLSLMYERKYNQTIEGVILTGGGVRMPGFLEAYKEVAHAAGRIATPFDQIDVPPFLKEMIDRIGPSYSVAVGCALKKILHEA